MRSLCSGPPIRIAFLTDFHFDGPTPMWFLRRAVDAAMEHRPHIVLIGGDLWTYHIGDGDPAYRTLSGLSAPLGIYAVPGNHDIYVGRERQAEVIRAIGGGMLVNEGVTIGTHLGELYLAGADDPWRGEPDLPRAMVDRPRGVPSLLLAHQARTILGLCPDPPHLCLSGHTHGGQICWPTGRPVWFYDRHLLDHGRGWARVGRTWVYVSRGVGGAFMPLRLNCRPEVAVFELEGPGGESEVGSA
jgi:hypothetical protein